MDVRSVMATAWLYVYEPVAGSVRALAFTIELYKKD